MAEARAIPSRGRIQVTAPGPEFWGGFVDNALQALPWLPRAATAECYWLCHRPVQPAPGACHHPCGPTEAPSQVDMPRTLHTSREGSVRS